MCAGWPPYSSPTSSSALVERPPLFLAPFLLWCRTQSHGDRSNRHRCRGYGPQRYAARIFSFGAAQHDRALDKTGEISRICWRSSRGDRRTTRATPTTPPLGFPSPVSSALRRSTPRGGRWRANSTITCHPRRDTLGRNERFDISAMDSPCGFPRMRLTCGRPEINPRLDLENAAK